jgi:hypothetical protein
MAPCLNPKTPLNSVVFELSRVQQPPRRKQSYYSSPVFRKQICRLTPAESRFIKNACSRDPARPAAASPAPKIDLDSLIETSSAHRRRANPPPVIPLFGA